MSYNEIYLLIKYIKSFLWRVTKRLPYTENARCLKVNVTPKHNLNTRSYWLWTEILFEGLWSPRDWQSSKPKVIINIIIFLRAPKTLPKEGRKVTGDLLSAIPDLQATASPHLPDTSVHVRLRQKMCDSYCTWLTSMLAELHSDTVASVILTFSVCIFLSV